MRKFSIGIASGVVAVLFTTSASAVETTTYSYQGNLFDRFHGADQCPDQCSMSGHFTIDGAPPNNLDGADGQFKFDVSPITYSFTDGAVTATNSNSNFDFLTIHTDAQGAVTYFDIRLFDPALDPTLPQTKPFTQLLLSNVEDITIEGPSAVNFAASLQQPGVWTVVTTDTSPIPETDTWLMMSVGFTVAGLTVRRQMVPNRTS